MTSETMIVKLPAELYREFLDVVMDPDGPWRGADPPKEALESAVATALIIFLLGLGGREKLLKLRDHVLTNLTQKDPEEDPDGCH